MNTDLFAERLEDIVPFYTMELIKQAYALEQQGRKDILHLSIGEPDFTAPPAVAQAAVHAIQQGKLQYTPAAGIPELRAAISQHYRKAFGVDVPVSRIVVTSGASGALLLACAALVDKGSEVLMPDPAYPCNRHIVAAFDGKVPSIPCGPEHRFQLSAEMVQKHWTAATKGVCIASPSNPTGTSIEPVELAAIIETVKAKAGFTIVDEIYQGLTYDTAPFTALSLDQDIVVINSFSKYFSMTGWRVGWMVIPESLFPQIEKLSQNLFICPSAVAQYAALACFSDESLAIFEGRKEEFRRRRDYIVPALRELGFKVPVMPDGAFYVYADCSALTEDADLFTRDLLHKTGVVMVPGLDFGPSLAKTYVRISYATSMDNLREAVRRLAGYLLKR